MSEERSHVEVSVPFDTPLVAEVTISVPVTLSYEPRSEVDPFPFVARCHDLAVSPRRATGAGALAAVHNTVRAALLAGHAREERRAGGGR